MAKRVLSIFLILALVFGLMPAALAAGETMAEIPLENGDFESGDATGWTLSGYSEIKQDANDTNNSTYTLTLWMNETAAAAGSASYSVRLTAGTYKFSFDIEGKNASSGLKYTVTSGSETLAQSSSALSTTDWANWVTHETAEFTLTENKDVTFTLAGTEPAAYWGHFDNLKLYGTGAIADDWQHDAGIYVPKIDGTDGDFMRGMDVSSMLSLMNSWKALGSGGFKDFAGNTLDGPGFFKLLADSGVNWIRLRVWNDPYNSAHKGYGGGNNDVAAAVTMGQWATQAGLKVLIDFHYSDFWADPSKQKAPKAWEGMSVDQKAAALEAFTYDSLKTLLDAGVDVGMVQVGNETNGGIAGVTTETDMCKLFSAGSKAIRQISQERGKNILVALHFTNPETAGRYAGIAAYLEKNGVDYDVFASSYYPYWHGTLSNLTNVLKTVADTYHKKVIVAETSWAFTTSDGDGHPNTITSSSGYDYPFSAQGQATALSSVIQAVRDVGDAGAGVFYWEPAWIPVSTSGKSVNSKYWEEYGSGWAASYAKDYDPSDAGQYYGGSAVDNQALFNFSGTPLESLKTYSYVQTGAGNVEVKATAAAKAAVEVEVGGKLVLPETVEVTYNVGAPKQLAVTWSQEDIAKVDLTKPGTFTIHGTVEEVGLTTTCTVTVVNPNYVKNPGFESSDLSMYTITGNGAKRTGEDVHGGSYGLHFWDSAKVVFTAEQTVTLKKGHYSFSLYGQGGDMGTNTTFIYATINGTQKKTTFSLTGYNVWKNPKVTFDVTEDDTPVTVGVSVSSAANSWGTFDDWNVSKVTNPTHSGGTATCTEKAVCAVCGETYGSLKAHEITEVEAKAPTCTEDGYAVHYACSVCGTLFADQKGSEVVTEESLRQAATGHTFKDGVCTVCGQAYGTVDVQAASDKDAPSVTVPESLADLVLTEEDKALLETGAEIKVTLHVENANKTVTPEEKKLIGEALGDYTLGQYLNLTLVKEAGQEATEITELSKPIRVCIAVPEALQGENRTYAVIRLHNGVATVLEDLDKDANTVTIETDSFSTFTVVYKEIKSSSAPATGDSAPLAALMCLMALSAAAVLTLGKRKMF